MTDDEIPLNIAGHEERDRETPSFGGGNADGEAGTGTDEGSTLDDLPGADLPMDDLPGDDDGEEVEPVELLVQLAEDGEIEPWDIDIVAVTDKFLDALDEADLRTSGRALFYASVLLRMKSDALLSDDEEEAEPEPEPWERPPGEEPPEPAGFDPVNELEQEMDRRLERKSVRGSPETLDDLVRNLREAERNASVKESRTYDTSDSPSGFGRGTQTLDYRAGDDMRVDDEPTEEEVTGTAHSEDIETVIETVRTALSEQYDAGREEVLFAEVSDAGGSRIMTFLALLFLANRDFVRLEQDEVFGDLWVQAENATVGDPAELLAD